MNKGIAIRTILFFLIGILVAVVLIYIVLTFITDGALSSEECKAIITNACNMCSIANWDSRIKLSQEVQECGKQGSVYWAFSDNWDCASGSMEWDCKALGLG